MRPMLARARELSASQYAHVAVGTDGLIARVQELSEVLAGSHNLTAEKFQRHKRNLTRHLKNLTRSQERSTYLARAANYTRPLESVHRPDEGER